MWLGRCDRNEFKRQRDLAVAEQQIFAEPPAGQQFAGITIKLGAYDFNKSAFQTDRRGDQRVFVDTRANIMHNGPTDELEDCPMPPFHRMSVSIDGIDSKLAYISVPPGRAEALRNAGIDYVDVDILFRIKRFAIKPLRYGNGICEISGCGTLDAESDMVQIVVWADEKTHTERLATINATPPTSSTAPSPKPKAAPSKR
jgi:hypothetical protein